MFPEAEFCTSGQLTLEEGDLILILTDGATECQNREDDFFGDERALQVVASERHSDAVVIVEKLYAAIREFASETPPCDDVTAVVAKSVPPPG
jgi:sigma-B regulation protein RsbU (phosphoserine phosphatase)